MADASTGDSGKLSLFRRLQAFLRNRPAAQMRESLEEVIEESERENPALSEQERLMLANLLEFGELRVDDVMVPRADIVAVEEKTPLCDLVALFREAQHSRLPVYRETLDDPIGIVLLKDVLGLIDVEMDGSFRFRTDVPLAKLRRNVLFVPPSMPALDLLLKMQATHIHLALVIDEYGGTDGLVTIEDLAKGFADLKKTVAEDVIRHNSSCPNKAHLFDFMNRNRITEDDAAARGRLSTYYLDPIHIRPPTGILLLRRMLLGEDKSLGMQLVPSP